MVPPPLAWVPDLASSLERALGTGVHVKINPTVNPLLFKLQFDFSEAQPGERMGMIWNLIQQYAAKNETVPQGNVSIEDRSLTTQVAVKRRLGLPRNARPWG